MKVLLALCLIAAALSLKVPLSDVLQSPAATLKLYGDYKTQQHLNYQATEDRMRLRLFKKNAQLVAAMSSEPEETAQYELNFFSVMTDDEKKQWLGPNATGHLPNTDISPIVSSQVNTPKRKLWMTEGAVTAIKNQGGCGSCWSFAAVGGLETRYQQKSGKLRNFSEQEYLDCTYEGQKDGCNGGWPDNGYEYSAKKGGRLAASSDYPYKASDGACRADSVRDAAVAYKITGSVRVGASEADNIQALADGSLSMALEVTGQFSQYSSGILKDNTCAGNINHGVTGVGYTQKYVLVRNSWGSNWGDRGYIKMARHHHNCELFKYSSYAKLEGTGVTDEGGNDKATDYVPEDEDDGPTEEPAPTPAPTPAPNPDCTDRASNCKELLYACSDWPEIANKWCRKSCGTCGGDDEKDDCENQHAHCEQQFCEYPEFAMKYCKKMCGHCDQ